MSITQFTCTTAELTTAISRLIMANAAVCQFTVRQTEDRRWELSYPVHNEGTPVTKPTTPNTPTAA